jgi:hypothetical protein
LVATPVIEVGRRAGPDPLLNPAFYDASIYNPLVSAQMAWDLGGGFGFSYLLGAYIDMHQPLAWSSTSINQRFALSYTRDGWNATANVIWGIHLDSVTDRPQISACPDLIRGCNPDFLNVDLTLTKKFGKWEIGPVAFGSTDLNSPVDGYLRQSQIALGGLIGYDFGTVTLQAYATTDVYQRNYGGYDTRVWGRVILPLWTAPTAPAPLRPLPTKG